MISESQIYPALAEIFADVFMRDDIPLSDKLSAKDVDGWDSFKQIEIIMATEERFAMKFLSSELDNMKVLGDLVRPVAQRGTLPR
jgi:acyl carrier protein